MVLIHVTPVQIWYAVQILNGVIHETPVQIWLAVRFSDFTTKTRIVTFKEPVAAQGAAAQKTIQFQALGLFMPFMDRRENPSHKAICLLGVKVERFK